MTRPPTRSGLAAWRQGLGPQPFTVADLVGKQGESRKQNTLDMVLGWIGLPKPWARDKLGYASPSRNGLNRLTLSAATAHARVDFGLFLPSEWAGDKKRLKKAGASKDFTYREVVSRRGKKRSRR